MTFLDIQESLEKAKVVILPIPHEKTITYKKGTSQAPSAIIEASKQIEHYDLESKKTPITPHTLEPIKYDQIQETIKKLKDKFIISLGGEHSISFPIVKELKEKYNNLTVLQIDAHADLRDEYDNNKFSHACVMSRILEICPAVQVGIRSISKEEADFAKQNNLSIFYMDNINNEEILNSLSENVYITLDVDAFDPSVIPSVGTPEPGGFTWNEMLELLKPIFEKKNVIGFDIVELAPIKCLHAADFTVAKLIYKMIDFKFNK